MHLLHLIFTLDGKGGKGKKGLSNRELGLGRIKDVGCEAFCVKGYCEMCAPGLGGLTWDPEDLKAQKTH